MEGSRVTVYGVHARVEDRETPAPEVADQPVLDVADVHEARAYYLTAPEEMREVEFPHERAVAVAPERSSVSPPGGLE